MSRKSVAPTAESIFNAEKVTSVASYKEIAKKAGEYQFNADSDDAKFIQSAMADTVSVHIWSEKNADGIVFTRGEATDKDGFVLPFRCFGRKGEIVKESTLTDKAKIAALVWGVCYQDGKLIDETKHSNGKCFTYPVAYLKLA